MRGFEDDSLTLCCRKEITTGQPTPPRRAAQPGRLTWSQGTQPRWGGLRSPHGPSATTRTWDPFLPKLPV